MVTSKIKFLQDSGFYLAHHLLLFCWLSQVEASRHVVSCPLEKTIAQDLTNYNQQGAEALSSTTAKNRIPQEPHAWAWEQTLPTPAPVKACSPLSTAWERRWTMPGFFIHRNNDVTNVCCFKQQQKNLVAPSHPTLKSPEAHDGPAAPSIWPHYCIHPCVLGIGSQGMMLDT